MKAPTKRLIFQVPVELAERLKKHIPWGFMPTLIRLFLEAMMDAVERDGQIVIGAILSGEYTLKYESKNPSPSGTTTSGATQDVRRQSGKEIHGK